MSDPLGDVISLLRPSAPFSKLTEARGPFRVRREDLDAVFYTLLLSGAACLEVDGKPPLVLQTGDFVLIPAIAAFTMSSIDPPPPPGMSSRPSLCEDGVFRIGGMEGPAEVQQLLGNCRFASPDAELLVSLLPDMVVVRCVDRLATLTAMVREEARATRPARDVVVEHLLQVLLIEAFRSSTRDDAPPGLLRGLNDARIGPALRAMHAAPDHGWTVVELAREASLSRSAFFTRFNRIVGSSPLSYLFNWRMALAKHMLRSNSVGIAEISRKIGYGSVSAFSTAFARHVGEPPRRYARINAAE
ncbi:AraC family transcriptional regulator [Notoacmeibacter sp. MSK16QG-6]|uniref:AraC family transcriptional regulator n=1 Tax=Notoacmeibacter sp. MSK16QG-6 TaxID=2957982 RepID=UPI00209C71AA|nr:AraC family transcriptional regulator [Notoacmeibacter sp. MSK16QG-6]MCP1198676.1 AraC family transcriptional regulator [Notoacmeibacter sp. MSK16QG-6]